jgi:putative heavy-metal-binding protein
MYERFRRLRLKSATRERGGNAVLAMRFDCNEIADLMSEIAAYRTAASYGPQELTSVSTVTRKSILWRCCDVAGVCPDVGQ